MNVVKRLPILLLLLNLLTSCVVYRAANYWLPEIDEYNAFPQEEIQAGEDKFYFPVAIDSFLVRQRLVERTAKGDTLVPTVDEYLARSATTAYIIIKNDTIIYEHYYRGYERSKISTFFSTTKSVTSLLVGIAVDEGHIKSVHDPVTDYIPELKNRDSRFQKLTIEHLLNMQAGLRFKESYTNPFKGMARLFYGRDQLGFIMRLKFKRNPGEIYDYNSVSTAILGIVLERAVNRPYVEYLTEKVWKPLGMEYDASMSLDDKKHRSAKSYQGLSATAIDLAKIGRLYMNGGIWEGKQIVSKEWIDKSTVPNIAENHISGQKYKDYQYHWYSLERGWYERSSTGAYRFNDSLSALDFAERGGFAHYDIRKLKNTDTPGDHWVVIDFSSEFMTFGIMGQTVYVNPEKKIIMVRLGEKKYNDNNVVQLTRVLTRRYPVLEKRW